MKLTYRRCGDYYLPNIGIPAEDMRPLGKYGRMRMRYLREHRSLLFNQLLLSGKLMKHLYSIDDACQERLDLLIPQMKAAEGVTEELKSADQMEWVRRMLDYQLEDMKEEVRRLEVVKREFIQENKRMNPERYVR